MKVFLSVFILFLGLNVFSQNCNLDNHSTNLNDSWLSCTKSNSPNPLRQNTHWIRYDLGYEYVIGGSHFWNYNVEGETGSGMKNVKVDFSLDGTSWVEMATFQLDEASGLSDYIGQPGPDFGKQKARYVLISSTDNWGSNSCSGLSEVRLDVEGSVSIDSENGPLQEFILYPNPAQDIIRLKSDYPVSEVVVYSLMGVELIRQKNPSLIDVSKLSVGIYFLRVFDGKNVLGVRRFLKK